MYKQLNIYLNDFFYNLKNESFKTPKLLWTMVLSIILFSSFKQNFYIITNYEKLPVVIF